MHMCDPKPSQKKNEVNIDFSFFLKEKHTENGCHSHSTFKVEL